MSKITIKKFREGNLRMLLSVLLFFTAAVYVGDLIVKALGINETCVNDFKLTVIIVNGLGIVLFLTRMFVELIKKQRKRDNNSIAEI